MMFYLHSKDIPTQKKTYKDVWKTGTIAEIIIVWLERVLDMRIGGCLKNPGRLENGWL